MIASRVPREVDAIEAGASCAMRVGLFFGDGLGRRLVPFGARGMALDRLLKFGLEGLSGTEAVTGRCEETGMRDLEFGEMGDPSPAFASCKGADTAMAGFQGSARDGP